MTLFLQMFPGSFFIFYIDQNLTVADIERNNPRTIVYMIPPGITTLINIICKLYALYVSGKMNKEKNMENVPTKFDLSLGDQS